MLPLRIMSFWVEASYWLTGDRNMTAWHVDMYGLGWGAHYCLLDRLWDEGSNCLHSSLLRNLAPLHPTPPSLSLGYATPVVTAGALSGSANMKYGGQFGWVNSVLASGLIIYGTYSTLDKLSRLVGGA